MDNYIPDDHAQILWNDGEDGKVTDFCIVDYREKTLQSSIANRYNNSNGADTEGWLRIRIQTLTQPDCSRVLHSAPVSKAKELKLNAYGNLLNLKVAIGQEKCWRLLSTSSKNEPA